MTEIWKDVKDIEGYQVSNLGNVRSIDRVIEQKNQYRTFKHFYKGKALKPIKQPNGYFRIPLGRENQKMLHRVVAEAFIDNPNNLPDVNHKDGNKENNAVANLEWISKSDNTKHGYETGLLKRGEERHNSKLTEEQVIWILKNHIKSDKQFGCMPLAKKFQVSHGTIDDIVKRKRWKHIRL